MSNTHTRRTRAWRSPFALALIVALLAGSVASPPARHARADNGPTTTYAVYLPLLRRPVPTVDTIFGAQMDPIAASVGAYQLSSAQMTWTRRNALLWSLIEPTEGARNWSAVAGLEQELILASKLGLRVILIVRSAPWWAQETLGSACGPIRADKRAAFANFMRDVVMRYKAAPFNVKYWEIWNEPDVAVKTGAAGDDEYGCWGKPGDPYFGGDAYAGMLQHVYPQIKAADAQAQVLVGGLLLDCDPDNPPSGRDCTPSKFLEGILVGGGGPYFDGVSFHAYDFYYGTLGAYGNANWFAQWNTTGPVSVVKANFLSEVLASQNTSGKYLMNTESALLCFLCAPSSLGDDFEGTKAWYLAHGSAAMIWKGVRANVWYNTLGWHNSGLLKADLTPQAAYPALVTARQTLRDAAFTRVITEFVGVTGYEFARADAKVWLVWRNSGVANITLPQMPREMFDTFGFGVPLSTTLTLDPMPVYAVFNP